MAVTEEEILLRIQESFPDAQIDVKNLSESGDNYSVRVISSAFEGKNRISQHRMVFQALQGLMGDQIHALVLHTSAPL